MLSTKSGDQQARAELLCKLLAVSGEKAYLLKYGVDRDAYFIPMVPVTDAEIGEWSGTLKPAPTPVVMGPLRLLPLVLEAGCQPGAVPVAYRDPAAGGWTASVAVWRFK